MNNKYNRYIRCIWNDPNMIDDSLENLPRFVVLNTLAAIELFKQGKLNLYKGSVLTVEETIKEIQNNDDWNLYYLDDDGIYYHSASDIMEPEDANFVRSLSWIPEALEHEYYKGYAKGCQECSTPIQGFSSHELRGYTMEVNELDEMGKIATFSFIPKDKQ